MRILIIGSRGFIGSHLASYFKSLPENTVMGCDVKVDPEDHDYQQVEKFNSDYQKLFITKEYDVCIFAGGNGSVPYSIQYPEIDYHLNTYAINRILETIHKHQPRCKFVHLSSAAVYGMAKILPINEDHPTEPVSPYGWHKSMSELICKKYSSLYNIQTINLRIFSVYGQGLQKQLFWDLYEKVKKSKKVILYGTGNESRDFIHISDLVKALDILVNKAKFQGEVYNIASGTEKSIREAATTFAGLYDKEIEIEFGGEVKAGDPINWRADIKKITEMGFSASVKLQNGLEQYIQWLRERELH